MIQKSGTWMQGLVLFIPEVAYCIVVKVSDRGINHSKPLCVNFILVYMEPMDLATGALVCL